MSDNHKVMSFVGDLQRSTSLGIIGICRHFSFAGQTNTQQVDLLHQNHEIPPTTMYG